VAERPLLAGGVGGDESHRVAERAPEQRMDRFRGSVGGEIARQQLGGEFSRWCRLFRITKADERGDPRELGQRPAIAAGGGEEAPINENDCRAGRIDLAGRRQGENSSHLDVVAVA
jgi:hypothetical protein